MKKFLTVFLVLSMLCALTPAFAAAAFPDVSGHWAEEAINAMAEAGAVNGYPDGTFRPDEPVTRAEFAKIITEYFDLPTGDFSWYLYEDVAPGEWYVPYIPAYYSAVDMPLSDTFELFGCPRELGEDFLTEFDPQRPLTRLEAAQAMDSITFTGEFGPEDVLISLGGSAADAASYSGNEGVCYLIGSVMEKEIMTGDDRGRFRPYDGITRAEVCTVLYRVGQDRDLTKIEAIIADSVHFLNNIGTDPDYDRYLAEEKEAMERARILEEQDKLAYAGSDSLDPSQWAQEVLRLVNYEREKEGLQPLELDADLCAVAQMHSDDMVARNFYDHVNPDGKSYYDRMLDYGMDSSVIGGENIAAGFKGPGSVVKGWMSSPGHRDNILYFNYTKMGIAWAYSDDMYGIYWTQDFMF